VCVCVSGRWLCWIDQALTICDHHLLMRKIIWTNVLDYIYIFNNMEVRRSCLARHYIYICIKVVQSIVLLIIRGFIMLMKLVLRLIVMNYDGLRR